jgi:F-type H+-transporting ATPase subunit b
MLEQIDEKLETERRKVLEEARDKADELLQAAREVVAEERQAALTEIREQVADLAVELASALLSKAGSGVSSSIVLENLMQQLQDMPTDERERLQKDLAAASARLTVVTATPLMPEERDQWSDRLSTCLGQTHKTDFSTDPDILGGAELRFPHAVLKLSWEDQLQQAKELLRRE